MESLGLRLKEAREKKGIPLEQIARDTNITRRYLEGLEEELFSIFPGETYLLGFLRNYAEYLGLDVNSIMDQYKNMKLQEQPIPVEALLKKTFPIKGFALALIIIASFSLLGILGFVFVPKIIASIALPQPAQESEQTHAEYRLSSGYLEKRFFINDKAIISFAEVDFPFVVSALGERVHLDSPVGSLKIELAQEESIDLNGDGHGDVLVFVADIYKNHPEKGASLRFELVSRDASPIPADSLLPSVSINAPPTELTATTSSEVGTAAEASSGPASTSATRAGDSSNTIFTSPGTAWPFTLEATFRGYCMFRWEIDRKDREERYFHKAETLTAQAKNAMRLWISNASAVKLVAIGGGRSVEVDVGRAGEVVVVDLKWVRDEDGQYRLITERLD